MKNNMVKTDENPFMNGYEPKKVNRFLIEIIDIDIPKYLFQNYKIYNIDKTLYFECEFFEPIHFSFYPFDIFKIKEINLSHLDPIGDIVSSYRFKVKNVCFDQYGSYQEDGLLKNSLRFETYYWTKIIDINNNTNSNNENNKSN